jgi:hypothetical protein
MKNSQRTQASKGGLQGCLVVESLTISPVTKIPTPTEEGGAGHPANHKNPGRDKLIQRKFDNVVVGCWVFSR